jgi:hypothetical protein
MSHPKRQPVVHLALVQDGDLIELNVPGRRLELMVDDAELEQSTIPSGNRQHRLICEDIRDSTLTTCCRPTKDVILIFCDLRNTCGPRIHSAGRGPIVARIGLICEPDESGQFSWKGQKPAVDELQSPRIFSDSWGSMKQISICDFLIDSVRPQFVLLARGMKPI